jgi:hypothetical protein
MSGAAISSVPAPEALFSWPCGAPPAAFLASRAGVLFGAYGYSAAVDALSLAFVSSGLARSPELAAASRSRAAAFLASCGADRFWCAVAGEVALGFGLPVALRSAAGAEWVVARLAL